MKTHMLILAFSLTTIASGIAQEKGVQTLNGNSPLTNYTPLELRFSGVPAGGVITIGEWQGSATTEAVTSTAGEPLQALVNRIIEKLNTSTMHIRATAKNGEPTTIVLNKAMPWYLYMTSTDTGIVNPNAVSGIAANLEKNLNKCTITWTIPSGTSYDYILVSKNQDIGNKISGTATSCVDDLVREADSPSFQDMDLQYRVIGWKNGLPSNLGQIWVLKSVRISTETLPAGQSLTAYSKQLLSTGGIAPFTWSVNAGDSLPAGLSLDANSGALSGTPTGSGTFYFTIKVTDSSVPQSFAQRRYELVIAP